MNFFTFIFLIIITISTMVFFKVNKKNKLPKDMSKVSFGTIFTDNMFTMEWDELHGWHNAKIGKYKPFSFDPSSIHMHYGCEIFEGMKAYKTSDGKSVLFRPRANFMRMNNSAERMCMPTIDVDFVVEQLKALVKKDADWIPTERGTSLYIRPTMIATEATINLKPSNKFLFFIIMSPVGAIYKEGFNPVAILVSEKYTRASIGGVGNVKTGGNYAASMLAQNEAKKEGYAQVMWLDPVERKYVEEVGSMNIFFVINNEIITPELTGTILPGITRNSILKLGKKMNFKMIERKISIDEIINAINNGTCTEIFGTGTAAVISPVGKFQYKDQIYIINNNQTGPITKQLFKDLTDIQYGAQLDTFNWIEFI
jgi:branched-chain amino acid aminotransferase